jgi:hypothetical protein
VDRHWDGEFNHIKIRGKRVNWEKVMKAHRTGNKILASKNKQRMNGKNQG